MPITPQLDFIGQIEALVGPALVIGEGPLGLRRIVPILGGRLTGPQLQGEILQGGADHQLFRPDGVAELVARYAVRLEDGTLLNVVNSGIRDASPDDTARLMRGEAVPPERVYFRTAPVFETASPAYAWLHRRLFVGFGERQPAAVLVRIYAV